MSRREVRHVVLDNEAAQALLYGQPGDPKRVKATRTLSSARGQRVVPTAVRVEAGWRRRDPEAAQANQHVPNDDVLDRAGADRAVQLRAAVPRASVVDAAVAVAAERLGRDGNVVEVLTSDSNDMRALAQHLHARIDVVHL